MIMAIQANPQMHHNVGGFKGNFGSKNTFFTTLIEKITATFSSYKKSIQATRDFNELNQLSDRELRDLGINRGEIAYIVNNQNHTK
jgi:uncharacterized protein YjiS (DUF1127 family)